MVLTWRCSDCGLTNAVQRDKCQACFADVSTGIAPNITIGVLGDPYFRKSPFCDVLSMPEHVASRYSIYKNKYIETRLGNKNAIIIDIECAQKYHSKAINAIADCDVIIYVISVMRHNGEELDRLIRRYLEIAHVFGVKHFIIAITKMEFVPSALSKDVFDAMAERVEEIINEANIEIFSILPVTALNGDNITTKSTSLKWYDGPTLMEILNDTEPSREHKDDPFQMTVTQFVWSSRFNNKWKWGDLIVGKVRSGKIKKGEKVKLLSSATKTEISLILRNGESVDTAQCGDLIRFRLDRMYMYDAPIKPGDKIVKDEDSEEKRESKEVPFRMRFGATIHVKQYELNDSIHCLKRILVDKVIDKDNAEASVSFEGLVQCGNIKVGERVQSLRTGKRGRIDTIRTSKWYSWEKKGPPQSTTEVNSTEDFPRIIFTVISDEDDADLDVDSDQKSDTESIAQNERERAGSSDLDLIQSNPSKLNVHSARDPTEPINDTAAHSKLSTNQQTEDRQRERADKAECASTGDANIDIDPNQDHRNRDRVGNDVVDLDVTNGMTSEYGSNPYPISPHVAILDSITESQSEEDEVPMELRSDDILVVYKEDVPSPRMYPIEFETKNRWSFLDSEPNRPFKFTVFLGNLVAKCLMCSIKWKVNVNGKRIENPKYLEEGDTANVVMEALTPIHFTPYTDTHDIGAFAMIHEHSSKITGSCVVGKVTKIQKDIAMQSVHRCAFATAKWWPRRREHYLAYQERRHKFVDVSFDRKMIGDTRRFLKSQNQSHSCDCSRILGTPCSDVALRKRNDSHNLCMVQHDIAITCGLSSNRAYEIAFALCNQMERLLSRLIPVEVVQIVVAYSRRKRNVFWRQNWSYSSKWKAIEELTDYSICKVVVFRRTQSRWRRFRDYREWRYIPCDTQLFLAEDGNLWETVWNEIHGGYSSITRPKPVVQSVSHFTENGIVIKDIAAGESIRLALDHRENIHSWGDRGSPRVMNFPFCDDEKVEKCIAMKCGERHSYVCFRVKKRDEMDREYVVDKHFLFGYNEQNQCLTFDGRHNVETPFCINETVQAHYGGEIDSVIVELDGNTTYIVVNHSD